MKLHFVRSIRGLQNFLAIPIMNTLAGFIISRYAQVFALSNSSNPLTCKHCNLVLNS